MAAAALVKGLVDGSAKVYIKELAKGVVEEVVEAVAAKNSEMLVSKGTVDAGIEAIKVVVAKYQVIIIHCTCKLSTHLQLLYSLLHIKQSVVSLFSCSFFCLTPSFS